MQFRAWWGPSRGVEDGVSGEGTQGERKIRSYWWTWSLGRLHTWAKEGAEAKATPGRKEAGVGGVLSGRWLQNSHLEARVVKEGRLGVGQRALD